jgi:hypothetical protein
VIPRLAWLGAGLAAGVAFVLPRVLNLEGELAARDDVDRDRARAADHPSPIDEIAPRAQKVWALANDGFELGDEAEIKTHAARIKALAEEWA